MLTHQWIIYGCSESGEFIEERTEDLQESLHLAEQQHLTILDILDTSYNPHLAPF